MKQQRKMHGGQASVLPWVSVVLAMFAGLTLFMVAGGISFDLAEVDSPDGPWKWLSGGGIVLAVVGFLSALFLASDVLIRRQRHSILPTTRLR